ncbi:hypothetical protein KP509_11G078400 [Ceratopteris richardii]|nr:hypothetical protein KP509_11G078400 [Ceratopteris richardii]
MEYGFSFEAYALFDQMQQEGIHPNEFTLVSTLKACSGIGEIEYGWNVHSFIIQHGFEHNLFIENTLMDMYVKCNNLETALIVLNKLSKQDVLAWSIILGAYAKNQMFEETLDVFCGMQQNGLKPDPVTCILLTKACQNSESLAYGRQIHSLIIENGQELQYDVGSSVVEMYVRCNSLEDAQALFERLPKHELPIWNVIIWGYCQVGNPGKAYQMLNAMEHEHVLPNSEIFERLIRGSLMSGELDKGKEIHSYLVKLGIDSSNSIQNALIDMYTEFGFFDDALQFFNNSSELDIVAWNIVISRYSQFSLNKEAAFFFEKMQKAGFYPNQITWNALISAEVCLENAIDLFWQMQVEGVAPNDTSFVCILQKCSIYGQLNQGMEFHSYAAKFGLDACMIIENMLIDMYAKNNSLETARFIFDKLKKWDVVTWNVMIAGYTMHGHALEALKLFYRMQQNNINPNKSSFVAVLQACASIALLEHGKQIHYLITSKGFELDLHVGNALLDFYAKCGLIQDVHVFLNRLPERDGVAWSTIISGCSKCCNYPLASQCFRDMLSENIKPNASIFLALLSACSHAHRLDEACFYLRIMSLQHGVTPTLEHFMILVELFGKVGLLKEAEELLETLPWSSKPVGWMSLLGSCKKHRSVELARRCFANLMEMREKSSSSYVLLSNIFEEAGMENAVEDVVRSRKHADAWKQPAKSYIEVDNQIHEFIVGDTSHPKCEEIYSKLRTLHSELKNEEGYEPHVGLIHKGLSIKEKEMNLWAHSEKLAVAFGLLCMPEGTTIRVAKNLRVCADCHDVAKLISIRERRDIVIKDTYCIHHFKDGSCCCENFN